MEKTYTCEKCGKDTTVDKCEKGLCWECRLILARKEL